LKDKKQNNQTKETKMMKRIIAIAIVASAFSVSAEAPIKLEYNNAWLRVAKKSIGNLAKSIEIEINKDECKEIAISSINNVKNVIKSCQDKIIVKGTETTNPSTDNLI
jgi:uncharacterized membrane protein